MEIFESVINFAKMGVAAFGAGIAISGIVNFGEGKSNQNQGKQDEGMSKIVGGGVIIAVAYGLIPLLTNMVTVG